MRRWGGVDDGQGRSETLSAVLLHPIQLFVEKRREGQRSQHNELYWRLRVWRADISVSSEMILPPKSFATTISVC